ncbi:hypothetical protein TrLO_g4098 [Triparma laevis f. longispina]|uniref:WW domain-containing protein n=2 Tax=Triparma laevis f. longispina TaxID=1714387 RepID=A0A9W7CIL9_9STRA|nr:hypothetical protein TrLO_g4098 [Triparma laevis f. longispina]
MLLAITYAIFVSVSTTVLDTFNCKTAMTFVYPVGIPLLYFGLQWKDRKELKVERLRKENPALIKTCMAIFFILFAALLTKVELDKTDNYDQNTFGYLLIFVNGLVHPWKIFMQKVGRVHKHDGGLREIPNNSTWETYWEYFNCLVESNADDAGWDEMKPREWRMGKKKGKKWLRATGAVEVLKHALKGECLPRGTFESEVVQAKNTFEANKDSSIDEYFLVQTPMLWWKRNFVVRRFVKKNEYSFDIIRKSLTSKQEERYNLPERAAERGFVALDGIRIESLQGSEKCKVTRVFQVDFSEDVWGDDMTQRLLGPSLKKRVSKVFDTVKRKTMGGVLGGGHIHTIDVEMTNRSSSFNFDNPMTTNELVALPMIGNNPKYDMTSFTGDGTPDSRRQKKKKRFLKHQLTMEAKAIGKSMPKVKRGKAPKSRGDAKSKSISRCVSMGVDGKKEEVWHVLVDPSSGDFYYENEISSETQWELPKGEEEPVTSVVEISNMLTEGDLGFDHDQLVADITEECAELGEVEKCVIPKLGEGGAGTVYVKWGGGKKATRKARDELRGRVYATGVAVEVWFKEEVWFDAVLKAGLWFDDFRPAGR